MTNYPDPVAAAIGELSNYADAVDQLGESVQGVFEHGGELVESRRRLASLLESSARELADVTEARNRVVRDLAAARDCLDRERISHAGKLQAAKIQHESLHNAEMREATRRAATAEARAQSLEQALNAAGVEYASGMRVRIGRCDGTVVPQVPRVRVRLDGMTGSALFDAEFVHHLPISDAEAAAQVKAQDARDGVADQEFQDQAETLGRHNHVVFMVRHLAEHAAHWQFGRDGHLWQSHEKRDFARWLREQATKINNGEELGL